MSSYGSLDNISDTSMSSTSGKSRRKKSGTSTPSHQSGKPRIPSVSVGVAYDIHNQPISVNTFGSVMPDVTSEVDLNTTSETDVENRKQYEPNILERALERTICYHPRRRTKASNLTVGLLCILTIVCNASILIICPIYTSSMRKAGGDEMVVLLSLAAVVPPPMVAIALLLRHAYDNTITLRPTAPKWLYILMGICFALRLNMVVFASHPNKTPDVLQPGLSSVIIPFTVIVTFIILGKRLSLRRLVCCVVSLIAIFISVEPRIWSVAGSEEGDLFKQDNLVKQIVWPVIYCMSFLPLTIYNVAAEKELKKNVLHSFSLSTSGLISGSVFTILLFGTNFLPWYGNVESFSELWTNFETGFRCNFSYAPGCHHCLVKLIVLASSLICFNIFSFLLISATEGSVFMSLVTCLAVPLSAAFWCVFDYDYDTDEISWRPEWTHSTGFVLASLLILLPTVIVYSIFTIKDAKQAKRELKGYSDVSSSEYDWE